ncbi:MAG: hypothetical protein EHM42_08955, partial [Planctomycetaceae bacterium]
MQSLSRVVAGLNGLASALGSVLLAPLAFLPGWVSSTLVAVVTGALMLLTFKYTSNQRAIKRARDQIRANLLALSLFKENIGVSLRAQGRILQNAGRLLVLAVVPMLVMFVPMCLVLAQLALWYQARPLSVGEEAIVTLRLADGGDADWPTVRLEPDPTIDISTGPVRALSQREVFWNLTTRTPGYHRLVFDVGGQRIEKELAAGDGYMRVSQKRPELDVSAVLL